MKHDLITKGGITLSAEWNYENDTITVRDEASNQLVGWAVSQNTALALAEQYFENRYGI